MHNYVPQKMSMLDNIDKTVRSKATQGLPFLWLLRVHVSTGLYQDTSTRKGYVFANVGLVALIFQQT